MDDKFLHGLGQEDDLVNRKAAGETGHPAAVAAFWRINLTGDVQRDAQFAAVLLGHLARHLAVGTKFPDEALGEEGTDGGGNEEGFHPHVHKPADAAHGVVGVQRGENQVTGERGADGDFRCLQVPDFPDHHDVRVRPQNRAQRGGEGEANLVFHRDLHHTDELVFHRVLDRDDPPLGVVHLGEEGVKAGGFTRSGRPGD